MTKEEVSSVLGHEPLTFEQMKEIEAMHLQHDWDALRNQAAIAAMQSIISNEDLFCRIEEAVNHEGVYDAIASDAVKMGNALIEELKKK